MTSEVMEEYDNVPSFEEILRDIGNVQRQNEVGSQVIRDLVRALDQQARPQSASVPRCEGCGEPRPGNEEGCSVCDQFQKQIARERDVTTSVNRLRPQPAAGSQSGACRCGFQLPDNARFCSRCGEEVTSRQGLRKCGGCGRLIEQEAKFCRYCGASVEPPQLAKCPGCQTVNPASAKFCRGCGSRRR